MVAARLFVAGVPAVTVMASALPSKGQAGGTRPAVRHLVVPAGGLQSGVKDLLAAPGPHFVLFSSDYDAATGKPWCPDCVRALPAVVEAVGQADASLLEVQVGPRAAWKTPTHPFRLDPAVALKGIPTLFHWTEAGPGERAGPELERKSFEGKYCRFKGS